MDVGPFYTSRETVEKLAFKSKVLKSANLNGLCEDPESYYPASDHWPEGKGRKFFEKCLAKGNPTAIYNKGIRIAVAYGDLGGAVDLLSMNVPRCGLATIGSAMMSICLGDVDRAVGFLQFLFTHHAKEGDNRLCVMGNEFKRNIYNHGPSFMSSSLGTFVYPECEVVRTQDCTFQHDMLLEDSCNKCYLYWCARSICRML